MAINCPLCDYEGTVSGVEAHISAKQDEPHQGKAGHEFKEDLKMQAKKETGQSGRQTGQSGQQKRPGAARGREGELPDVVCKDCGRKVKYPELMPQKMSCPECGRTNKKRDAAEKVEERADDEGTDETAETVTV